MTNYTAPIRVITLSREFGAGGRRVGELLAQALGWKLWDKELVHELARVSGISERDLLDLDEREIHTSLWARLRGRPSERAYLAALKEWMDQIAEQGNGVVIGRGASILMRYRTGSMHLRLSAPLAVRAQRARELEPSLSLAAAEAKCRQMDAERARYVKFFFGEDVADPLAYHATLNAGEFPPEAIAEAIAAVVRRSSGKRGPSAAAESVVPREGCPRILTLTSQLGSRETDLGRELARRLNLTLYDRETLAREAGVGNVADDDLKGHDPHMVQALRQVMANLGSHGDVLVVGRGGGEFLRNHPSALRVKLVAPLSERIRRVVEYRWVEEKSAQKFVTDSDAQRRAFYNQVFQVDWCDPLRYDLVLNTAALGPRTVDLIVQAASLKWHGHLADSIMTPPAVAGAASTDR